MATESDHIALANKNHDALLALLPQVNQHPEWVTTIAFYKAVQIVEATLVKHRRGSSCSHRARADGIKAYLKNNDLYRHYSFLQTASRVARYLHDADTPGGQFQSFTDYIAADAVFEKVIKKRLVPLEQLCLQFLSEASKRALKRAPDSLVIEAAPIPVTHPKSS